MTLFQVTEELKQLLSSSDYPDAKKVSLASKDTITHAQLVDFYQECHPTPSLLGLIRKSKLVIPRYETSERPKTKEFVRQMERLRVEAREQEYKRLVNKTPEFGTLYENTDQEYISPAKAHKELKNQLTTIVNIGVSVGSVSYAIWYWTGSSWGLKESYRALLTIFFGLLILVAEVVVYMGYINKIEEAKAKEHSKREVKKVLRSFDLNKQN
ncbi:uncharacterized protein LODBEIA_P13430 [Lodderomyces beijingensis]|uniref:Vacuolar ATPase assembly integral membrane protein VPH2 n=1 Tax=Lodderomyces beijingensis TaxID=1775926 RepID=A0ABP0ZG10_9ASCO